MNIFQLVFNIAILLFLASIAIPVVLGIAGALLPFIGVAVVIVIVFAVLAGK